jgi:hypothetical protein
MGNMKVVKWETLNSKIGNFITQYQGTLKIPRLPYERKRFLLLFDASNSKLK